jgi:hypothetical protein
MGAEASLILACVGLFTFYALGFIYVSLTGVIGIIVSAIIILVKVARG